ncbi:MAG: hypothetical protein NC213_06785 [Acetobacter sp.]|nr:hypothetical protein [Bacteroides sp.]MCM1341432.1 hypothetical protein [Acetobacter sp.]MCM1433386.1 hypothetical protein [Clostridiales bacterium]
MLIPFIMCSAVLVLYEISALADIYFNNDITALIFQLFDEIKDLFGYFICYFIVMQMTNGRRWLKSFSAVVFIFCFNTAFSSLTEIDNSYIFALILGIIFSYVFNYFNSYSAAVVNLMIALLFGYASGYLTEYFNNTIMSFGEMISDKGIVSSALYGGINSLFSLFDSHIFSDLFFFKSMGGSLFINDEIVTGAMDLFAVGYNGDIVSSFLSGKFYLLFSLAGISIALGNEIKGVQKNVLVAVCFYSIISGNIGILLLYFILENIMFLIPVILLSALSYVSAYLLELSIGYMADGGIVEMIININDRWVYLFAGILVFTALGYFTGKYFIEKRGISDCMNIYYPARLNKLIKSLGGIENIIRIKNSKIEVRNPQLVNLLGSEYDINGNIVTVSENLIVELKEYLE